MKIGRLFFLLPLTANRFYENMFALKIQRLLVLIAVIIIICLFDLYVYFVFLAFRYVFCGFVVDSESPQYETQKYTFWRDSLYYKHRCLQVFIY